MGTDTFICGECQTTFHDINAFLQHKNSSCQGLKTNSPDASGGETTQVVTVLEDGTVQQEVQLEQDAAHAEAAQTILQVVGENGPQTIEIVQEEVDEQQWELLQAGDAGNQVHVVDATDENVVEEIRIVSSREGGDGGGAEALRLLGSVAAEAGGVLCGSGETVQVVKLNPQQCATLINANSTTPNAVTDSAGVDLVSSLTSADEASQSGARNSNAPWRPQFQILVKNADGTVTLQPCPETLRHVVSASGAAPEQPKKRRPGRPRKGMERLLPPEKKKEEKPKEPITGKDGKLTCPKCKKHFGRLRHFRTHRCLAAGDYGVLSDEEDEPEESERDHDEYQPKRREIEQTQAEDTALEMESDRPARTPIRTPRKPKQPSTEPVLKKGRGRPAKIYRLRDAEGHIMGETSGEIYSDQALLPLNMPRSLVESASPLKDLNDVASENAQLVSDAEGVSTETSVRTPQPKGVVMADPLSRDDGIVLETQTAEDGEEKAEQLVAEEVVESSAEKSRGQREAKQREIVEVEESSGVTGDNPMLAGPPGGTSVEETSVTPDIYVSDGLEDAQFVPSVDINKDMIADLPVFTSEEEKLAFEETLNLIDMTQCDHLFDTHVIPQELKENVPATPAQSRMSSTLSVFTCTVCDKVFKMLSHVRNHVLGHTDLKPFACRLCEFSTNNKGNLYTHMRRHTGQLYRCPTCDFTTCNKSHLVEHIRTHARSRQACRICGKKYTTSKSLANHVRRYHRGEDGSAYLSEFHVKEKKPKGPAVLHECHVCNRKFKKQLDRDRHLFIHKVKPDDNMHLCELCEFSASRRIYLEKHFRKHRVVYTCFACSKKFPSALQLNSHLSAQHGCGELDDTWEEMFTKCIENSLFQPEPDAPIRTVACVRQTADGAELDTVPETTLSAGLTKGQSENAKASELLRHMMRNTLHTQTELDTVKSKNATSDKEATKRKNEAEAEVVENEEESNSEAAQALETKANYNIYQRLEFVPMTMDIFHRLRQAFGNEECEFCGRLYYSRADCLQHVKTHTGDRPFQCNQCTFRSITRDQLKRHIERDHDNIKYVCHECEYVAPSRTNLWHHQQKHRKPQSVACPACGDKFDSAKRLKIHIEFKHPGMPLSEAAKAANAVHKTNGKLGRKSFRCPYCDRQFVRGSSELQKHIWIHEGIKPYKCPLCTYACRSKSNLTNHLLRHSSEKPFLCMHCGKAYKSKTALRWHVRTHKEGKLFKCNKCEYEATQKSHLVRHLETHNVVKRFQCQLCDYSANTLGYIKIHYTRAHEGATYSHTDATQTQMTSKPDTKVYKCLSCDYLFGNMSDMKRHLKIRHHVQVDNLQILEEEPEPALRAENDSAPQQLNAQVTGDPTVVGSGVGATAQQVPSAAQNLPTAEEDATSALQALQYAVPPRAYHQDKTVDVLHQILGLQGGSQTGQPITVQSNDGQTLQLSPDTIIVQDERGDVVLTSASEVSGAHPGQYVIQYVDEMEQQVVQMAEEQQDAVQTIMAPPDEDGAAGEAQRIQVVTDAGDMVLEEGENTVGVKQGGVEAGGDASVKSEETPKGDVPMEVE